MSFVKEFVSYMQTRTDAPPNFHVHAAMACLAAAAGNRIWTDGWTRPIYPNLWIVLIAPSGFGKSAPLDMAQSLLLKAGLDDLLLPNSWSQEALISTVAQQPCGIFIQQEFARFLEILGREYNHGAMEMLTEWYDVPEIDRRVLRGEKIEIKRPTISILGASSPDWFATQYRESMLRGGFLARFIFCPSQEAGQPVEDPGPRDEGRETVLADWLRTVHGMSGKVDFSRVRKAFAEWDREQRLRLRAECPPDFQGMRARAGALVKKASILFHLSWSDTLTIDPRDLDNAIRYVAHAQAMAEKYLSESVARDKDEADRLKVIEVLTRRGGRAPHSDTLRNTHLDAQRLERAIRTLREAGLVIDEWEGSGKGRTRWYRLLRPNPNGTVGDAFCQPVRNQFAPVRSNSQISDEPAQQHEEIGGGP